MIDKAKIKEIAKTNKPKSSERHLLDGFCEIYQFLSENPEQLSWRGKNKPKLNDADGIKLLSEKYFEGYRKSDFPAIPGTIPDEMVSIVMKFAYNYTDEELEKIKVSHQHSMCAENCVGALLERYLFSVLKEKKWYWCCGNFVKAIDFIRKDEKGKWLTLQIKNRDNSENSSSSSIRSGTEIQKWFRTFSKKKGTNWENLPSLMQGYELSEVKFLKFVKKYLTKSKSK